MDTDRFLTYKMHSLVPHTASPLAPFVFVVSARGESGNKATKYACAKWQARRVNFYLLPTLY